MNTSPLNNPETLQFLSGVADRLGELHAKVSFHEKQLEIIKAIFEDGYKRVFICKGRKAGGTEVIMYPCVRIIGTAPNSAAYIIGPTQKAQCEIIWDNRRIHNYAPASWNGVPNEQQKRIRFPNQSFIKIDGADNPEAARGWEGDVFVWDERKDHNQESLDACYPNVAPRDAVWMELGTPPTTKTNSYYVAHQLAKKDPDWYVTYMTAWDNPFLPGGHEWLKKERDKYYARGDGDLWEIEWEGKYVFNARRKVLSNLREAHFVPPEVIESMLSRDKQNMRWVCSIDPGYATCFAVLFAGYNPCTAEVFLVDEIYSTERDKNSVQDMWPLIEYKQKKFYDGRWTTLYDSAALSFAVEVNRFTRRHGGRMPLMPTNKQRGDEDEYFRAINASLTEPQRVFISTRCTGLREEAENYETDDHDRYPDKLNHQLDNWRYTYKHLGYTVNMEMPRIKVINTLPDKPTPIEDIRRGEGKEDFVGYGGANANFDPMKVLL